MINNAQVRIKDVVNCTTSPKTGWTTYKVRVILSESVIAKPNNNKVIDIIKRSTDNWIPIIGDLVDLYKRSSNNSWFVRQTPFNGNPNAHAYIRDTSTKELLTIGDREYNLYRLPDFSKVLWFEIKPVLCFFNELTGFQSCKVVTNRIIDFEEHPDQLIWSIYERQEEGVINLIGDWEKAHEAQEVFDYLRDIWNTFKNLKI